MESPIGKSVEFPIGKYVIVRTYSAGVFAGTLDAVDGDVVQLKDARRLWYWDGASSLSELAMRGVSRPRNCKFPVPVGDIAVKNWIEIAKTMPEAEASIKGVAEWTQFAS